ncbi:PTS sugar transporter subunit IIB [Caproiciproducens galactitolivorans]|uniref:PTS sugar transporter subunit IIB n=1 Tax=Caproiciproducens galactitolivorans TaxID=642589 RepID=A0ABT4BRI4_9FIRM|nr:PTS sugar transporter subunit IIB [Caproiciproducens galactitolivorans]MCY1713400.1 PTS sugar transporter subunit IIB [Caproiciproducens galactitolivorans]
MIKLLRVDHRLIHGQVVFSWTSFLQADCILVACDAVVNDEIRKTTMKLSKPNGVKLVIKGIDASAEAINSGKTDPYKLFIVVESIADAEKLTAKCPQIKEVNLGGVKKTDDRKRLSAAVYANDEEIELIKKMISRDINIEIRQTPSDKVIKAEKVI